MRATPRGRQYTLILIGDRSSSVRKVQVAQRTLRTAAGAVAAFALMGAGLSVHYASLLATRGDARTARAENARLRSQLHAFEERISHITATLDRVEEFDAKLRGTVKKLEAPGPTGSSAPRQEERPTGATGMGGPAPGTAPSRLALLDRAASSQESSLRSLTDYFQSQEERLAMTPAAWPARGWVTSDFGERLDPYTAERMMHHGLDIATRPGDPVVAPSDATVTFAGTENGYGKVLVLDHGYGVRTRYGHLSAIFVKPGQQVKRGARVAAVGNTGRSTGPHLHYEVRVNGVAENPRKFILQ